MTPTDHGPRPRSRFSRAATASRRQALQRLELERAAEADQRRRPPRAEPVPRELRRARSAPSSAQVGAACRPPSSGVAARMMRALDLARALRQDQLAGDGAQERLRDGAGAHRAEAAQPGAASRPSSGSSAKRSRNSVWSSSRPSTNRTWSTPASLVGGDDDRAVGALRRLHAARAVRRPGSSTR